MLSATALKVHNKSESAKCTNKKENIEDLAYSAIEITAMLINDFVVNKRAKL